MKIDFSNPNFPAAQTDFEAQVLSFIENWFDASKTVEVQTSGSTGTPKLFEVEKSRMRHSATLTCDFFGLKEGDSALLCLPVEYISGKMMLVRTLERKLKLTVAKPSVKPLETLSEEIDFCALSPLQVENSLDKLHFLKNLIIGGAAVSDSLKNKITQTLKPANAQTLIYETYGMSETLSHIALKQIYPVAEDYFQVLGDVTISLDKRSCLTIEAPKLTPEILHTNDLVEIQEKENSPNTKQKFKFLGRIDNVINSGGLKIFPEQLESLVKKLIPHEVVFLGLPDELLGEKLVLVIEGEENENTHQHIFNVPYPSKNHRPKEIVFVAELPRIANGKINRRKLKEIITKTK